MTNKEAKDVLNGTIYSIDELSKNGFEACTFNWSLKEFRQVCEVAVDAVEKQIPTKRTSRLRIAKGGLITTMYKCGRCGHILDDDRRETYCPWCGQAILYEEQT